MMVNGVPLIVIDDPIAVGDEDNQVRQKSWLMMATASRPATRSSSARKKRPCAGWRPSSGKSDSPTQLRH